MRDVDQSAKDPEVDAPPRDTRGAGAAAPKGAAKRKAASAAAAQASVQHSTEAAPWFSGAGLRRRISLYHDQDTSEDRGEQEAATGAGRRRRRRHEAAAPSFAWVAGAASAAAALLIVGVPLAIMSLGGGRTAALLQAGGAPGASRYLRDLAALYDRTAGGGAPPEPAGGLTATMAGCAARAGPLPPVTLLPPRGPPARAPTPAEDPLRALDLDCGAPGGEEACARVVQRTNSYEGAAAAASEDLVGYLSAWEAYAAAQAAAKREALAGAHVPSDLDSLALDCDADPAPAACDGAAAASNSYEGDTSAAGAASAAAAEAQAYLDSLAQARRGGRMVGHVASAPQGPDGSASIDALALDCEADAAACAAAQAGSNAYERAESAQERARIAEEAASAYQGADSLALDCSGDAGSAPACARARASGGVYERTESRIERARIAEEASPASLGVDALSLDCWGPNGDGTGVDAAVAAECARSRAANNYELKPAHGHSHGHGHGHSHGEQPELQIGADGLPIGGPVQGYYSWIADVEGVNDAEVAAHAATYQAGGRAARGAGYDAPAFEADPVAAALARRGGARRRAATRAPDAAAEGPEAAGDDYEAEARAHADSYEAAYAKGDSAAREAGAYDVEAVERRRMQAAQQKVQEQSAGQVRQAGAIRALARHVFRVCTPVCMGAVYLRSLTCPSSVCDSIIKPARRRVIQTPCPALSLPLPTGACLLQEPLQRPVTATCVQEPRQQPPAPERAHLLQEPRQCARLQPQQGAGFDRFSACFQPGCGLSL